MKTIIRIITILVVCSGENAFAALSSTFSLAPANTSVTMGDSSATMPFQVTNTGDVAIKSVQFSVNTAVYNIGSATTPPSGWNMSITAAGTVCFSNSSAPVAAGSTQAFSLVLTGPSAGAITAASADQTDVLASGSGSDNAANCTGVTAPTSSPSWARKALAVDLTASPSSVSVGGSITLTMQVTNRSTAAQSGIVSSPTFTPAAVTKTGGPTPASLSLAAGASSVITWTFRADSTATVFFSASAGNASATSKTDDSNEVVIGNFTADVSVSPLSVISGQTVTVTMVVANNGSSALGNVTPTLTASGTATTKTRISGPTPANITSLAAGTSGSFTWVYTISGAEGQTYYFSGYATAGANTTNTAVSETGSITIYSVTVSPDTVALGSANLLIGWTVYNNGSKPIKEVRITYPAAAGWTYQSADGVGWTVVHTSPTVYYTAGTLIPIGGSKTFYITFSSIPVIVSDTAYSFPVTIIDQSNNTATISTTITETAYIIILTYSPASPISADGTSKYTLTATLTKGGGPVSGVPVTFTTTAGTLSVVPPRADYTTDAGGEALAHLTSPCSQSTINPIVRAEYLNALDQELLGFSGVATGALVYVGGSLTPMNVATAPTYTGGFTLQLRNCGSSGLSILTANSTLVDAAGNSFTLTSAATINSGMTGTLCFNTNPVSSSLSKCYPRLTVNDSAGTYTGPFAYNKIPRGDKIGDALVVNGGTFCPIPAKIIDWREVVR